MESQSLEQVLLALDLITREQLTTALEYQCRLPVSERLPLAEVLVEMELVSWETIAQIEGYLASPAPSENTAERIRASVQELNLDTVDQKQEPLTEETETVLPVSAESEAPIAVQETADVLAQAEPVASEPLSTVAPPLPPPVEQAPAANEEWQKMHAMEEWQQMQSLCVVESQGDAENLDKIMGDLGISDPRALQVGFTIKRKP